jgi:signal transduction histidine kinase
MTPLLEQVPRVRVEWVIAVARVVLAGGSLVAVTLDPLSAGLTWPLTMLLAWYLFCSLGILALVWSPVRFGRGWDVGLHAFDLFVFTMLMVITSGATSPFFVSLFFLLTCATLRWQLPGIIWTACAAGAAYAGASLYVAYGLKQGTFDLEQFVIRSVYLLVITALLGYISLSQLRFYSELSRLAAWPRTVSRDPRQVIAEVVSYGADLLLAPRALLVWEDTHEGRINLAWLARGAVEWVQESDSAYGSIVLPSFEGRAFSTPDASQDREVVAMTPRGFTRRRCRPIDERLRARFDMRAAQAWPLQGELVRGRLFLLDKPGTLDDLVIGEFVARLVASRLDSLSLLDRLREATALEERIRVARDLHDSLLQSQAGAAFLLMSARRMLDRDPPAAKERLHEVQQQLERGELEMRSFIRGLRPDGAGHQGASFRSAEIARTATDRPSAESRHSESPGLEPRLQSLCERMERQYDHLKVRLQLLPGVDRITDEVAEHVYRLVHEGVANAARHADASLVTVELSVDDGETERVPASQRRPARASLTIVDDGKGFPFTGTYDLNTLARMNRGPITLKERVIELHGSLTLTSSADAGTRLLITVPIGT